MNFWCWLLGHKWDYNFVWMPSKRMCKRCDKKEKQVINQPHGHPKDLHKWVDV